MFASHRGNGFNSICSILAMTSDVAKWIHDIIKSPPLMSRDAPVM